MLGRPVLAVPEAPRRFSMLGWRLFHTSTFKRKVIQKVMQMAVLSGLDGVLCRSADSPLEGLAPESLEGWLEEVRSELGMPELLPVVIWPPQKDRGRVYVHFVEPDGKEAAFAKVSFDTFNDECLKKESRILGTLKDKGLKHCRVPAVLAEGRQNGHKYLIIEPLPLKACHIHHTLKAYPREFVEELSGAERHAEMNEIESFDWWQRFANMAEVNDSFGSFKKELEELIIACSGLPVCRVHGDLGPANIVVSKEDLWIFDWEESSENGPLLTDRIGFDIGVHWKQAHCALEPVFKSFIERNVQGVSPEKRRDVMAALAFRVTFEKIVTGEYIRSWKRRGI